MCVIFDYLQACYRNITKVFISVVFMEPFYPPQVCRKLGHPGVCTSWVTQVCHTAGSLKCVPQCPSFQGENPQHRKSSTCFKKPQAAAGSSSEQALGTPPCPHPTGRAGAHGAMATMATRLSCSVFGKDKTLLEQLLAHSPEEEAVPTQLNSLLHLRQEFTPKACLQFRSLVKYLHKHDQYQLLFQLCVLVSCFTA